MTHYAELCQMLRTTQDTFADHPTLQNTGTVHRASVLVSDQPRILLVDDEPMIRKLGQTLLQRAGFHVTLADGAHEGVRLFYESEYDLVVLDLVMPEMSGHEVFDIISEHRPDQRVLFCSAYSNQSPKVRDGVAFISKPFRNEEFLQSVRRLLIEVPC
jgi:two-component system, cell cycle sensor histidine kinase and response regulator CckA